MGNLALTGVLTDYSCDWWLPVRSAESGKVTGGGGHPSLLGGLSVVWLAVKRWVTGRGGHPSLLGTELAVSVWPVVNGRVGEGTAHPKSGSCVKSAQREGRQSWPKGETPLRSNTPFLKTASMRGVELVAKHGETTNGVTKVTNFSKFWSNWQVVPHLFSFSFFKIEP